MNCPKCTGQLQPQSYGDNINVHRCDVCAGLWCKPDALLNMKRQWMAEAALDVGDPRVGQQLDRVDDIDCPEGHGRLKKSVDPKQTHIWYEECETCGGIYLDAGEFTDLKFKTLLDRVRALRKGPRPDA
ncbi:MAG: zf-TFIIB domain-containing protein [Pseudomonadota bacterium]